MDRTGLLPYVGDDPVLLDLLRVANAAPSFTPPPSWMPDNGQP